MSKRPGDSEELPVSDQKLRTLWQSWLYLPQLVTIAIMAGGVVYSIVRHEQDLGLLRGQEDTDWYKATKNIENYMYDSVLRDKNMWAGFIAISWAVAALEAGMAYAVRHRKVSLTLRHYRWATVVGLLYYVPLALFWLVQAIRALNEAHSLNCAVTDDARKYIDASSTDPYITCKVPDYLKSTLRDMLVPLVFFSTTLIVIHCAVLVYFVLLSEKKNTSPGAFASPVVSFVKGLAF